MSFPDLFLITQWWLIWLLVGLVFLPLTFYIFNPLVDHGYALSKVLGILLISYTAWILGSLRFLPFNSLTLFGIWIFFVLISSWTIYHLKKKKGNVSRINFGHLKIYLLEEGLFLGGMIFWAYIRAHEPSIHGLEKYMDFGFINSILRSEYFPPKDLWMTPLSINYYYFGHLVVAVVTKMSGMLPEVTYNLTLATIFAITLSASFSISANLYHFFSRHLETRTYNLKPVLISGLLAAFLVTLGGNLHTIYVFFQTYAAESPVPFWQLQFMFNPEGYWYPNATRFIPFTIHEFPLYSFVVADLHGHVLNIPFVLLLIALLVKSFHQTKLLLIDYLLLGLLIATSLTANVLDGPIYLLVVLIVLCTRQLTNSPLTAHRLQPLAVVSKQLAVIILIAAILSLPFWISFKPFAQGIGVLCAPQFLVDKGHLGPFLFEADHCARSPLWMLAILWGFPYFVIGGFLFLILKLPKSLKALKLLNPADHLVLAFTLASTLLVLIPEFFYAKDIYPAHYRANTVFKFGYQAFMIFGLISGYMLTRLISNIKSQISKFSLPYYLILIPLFFLVAIYPYFAINSYYNGLKTYSGLNGLDYLSQLYPTDYAAILWLRDNITGPADGEARPGGRQPVILEGQGDSYTDFARVSSNTGLPTVIGWPVHEWLWRGTYTEAGKRVDEVTQLYESPDLNLTKQLIKKYNISYVFVGALERQKYLGLREDKFVNLGQIIFQMGGTTIYRLMTDY